ncbi:MAG TPA: efflux RND transporter permease subunit [Gemmatimonadales bacterium]|jgi:CzcA family heavy metal efflux pump|nr:efflux RND transporter permease subunit [Gemmatimonadales bacterium]
MSLASQAIRRPIGTLALWSVVIVLGLFYVTRLPLDLLPQIVYPQIRANVNYPGVAPEVMEEQVTKVLEAALATTENLVSLESETEEGRSGVNLHFRYGTDINFALQDASKNLDRARARLPEDADPATIFKFDPSQIPVYEVAFSSATRSPVDLRDWVDLRLRPQLLTVEGIASIDVSGGLVREIHVTLDQERLRSYGLAVADVLQVLRDANQDVAAGNVTSPTFELVGKTEGKFRSVRDIQGVLLTVPGSGQRIPLSEVARVEDTNQDQRLWVRLDGVPAVKLSVRKQPDANTLAVARGVGGRLDQLGEQGSRFIPSDIRYEVINDQSFFIRNAVRGVRDAAVMGGVLAMLIVLLFLGSVRKTVIIGTAIPLAVLAAFFLMGVGNLTLNIMSLGGLALGVGMLVDNAIVMLENIFRHREMDVADPEAAAHRGAGEVTSAVIASTATSLAAVVPFLLISGLAALIFRELILTISFAMLASLGTALSLVPMLAAQLGKVQRTSGLERTRVIQRFDEGLDRLRAWYRGLAGRAVRRRGWVLGGAFAALALSLLLVRGLGNEFLPAVDDGNLSVGMRLPPGTTPAQTNELAGRIEGMVREMPYVQHMFTTAGGFLFGGGTATRSGRGSINVILASATERDMSAGEWVERLQRRLDSLAIPGARLFVRPPSIRGLRTNVSGSEVSINVQGDDLAELQRIGLEVIRRIQGIPGLESVEPSADEASPQLVIALDRQRAAELGLNVAAVGQAVRVALDGAIPTRLTDRNQEYDIRVRLPREQFRNAEDLGSIALFAGRDRPVYLRDVANVQLKLGPTSIRRENQNRQYRVDGDVNDAIASVGEVNREIRDRLAGLELPNGYGLVYGGEEETIRENQRNLFIVTALAVFLVWVVMAVQYESVTNPLVILVSVPLALIGVVLLLWITQTPLSAPALLGVILLAGIVVNNAILLVEYVEQIRAARDVPPEEAVVEAGAIRLRPILMTTTTTVLGMLPLAVGIGEGTELMRPLALAVVGGLSISTLLTLIVIPCAYLVLHAAAARLRGWVIGRRSEPAPEAAD